MNIKNVSSSPSSPRKEQIEKIKDGVLDFFDDGRRNFPAALGLTTYRPKHSDVIITTFPKAGTTLTQQLVYQVFVFGGHASADDPCGDTFTDICDKVPWLNYLYPVQPYSAFSPRLYKTHSPAWRFVHGRQRHVVVLRDPGAFPSSWLDFSFGCFPEISERVGLFSQNDEVDGEDTEKGNGSTRRKDVIQVLFDAVYARHVLGTQKLEVDETDAFDVHRQGEDGVAGQTIDNVGPWFKWARDWTNRAKQDGEKKSVLILFYEDIVGDMERCIAKVAGFLGVRLSGDDVREIMRRCSREYMMSGEQFLSKWDARVLGVDAMSAKVLPERKDGFKRIAVSREDDVETRRQMKIALGYDTYEEFRRAPF